MVYNRYKPQPPLNSLVQCLWYSEGLQGSHAFERILPNGEFGIVLDLREEPVILYDGQDIARFQQYSPAVFCGARSDCFVIDTSRQERVIGIQFTPGGALPFLRMPAWEVADQTCELDDIWPRQAASLRERLLSAASVPTMFQSLEQALFANLRLDTTAPREIRFAIHKLAAPHTGLRIQDVADAVGMGKRQFLDQFRNHTGLTPKAFQQVRRFQTVLAALHRNSSSARTRFRDDWACLALECGYYDQPHFIHDFRRFSSMTPGDYLATATAHLNHVPIP